MTTHPRARRPSPPLRSLALLAVATLAGCDALQANPGSDFAVRPIFPGPLRASGEILVPFDFTVDGCAAFDAAMRGPDRSSHPVAVRARPGGGFTADLPTAWLRDDTLACADDDLGPRAGALELEITCRDAGRTVALEVATSHATAARAVLIQESFPVAVQFVFPGVDPMKPYVLAPSLTSRYASFRPAVPGFIPGGGGVTSPVSAFWGSTAMSPQPRLAVQGRSMFLSGTGADFFPPCAPIEVAPGLTAPCTFLLDGDPTLPNVPLSAHVPVPGQVLDVAFLPDGRLLVLSQLVDATPRPTASVLSVVEPALGGHTTRTLAVHPGEWLRSGLVRQAGGGFAWLSLAVPDAAGPVGSVLHTTDGDLVADLRDPLAPLALGERLDGAVSARATWLSPDAAFAVVHGAGEDPQLGPLFGPFHPLRADSLPDVPGVGAAWPSGAAALWSGTTLDLAAALDFDHGHVQVFEATPPHARRYDLFVGSLPGAHRPTQLVDVVAVGNRLVLTTTSGVRVLGPGGELVGGADPLPCGLSPTSLAVRVGPSTVAVGAGRHVFTFDVGAR